MHNYRRILTHSGITVHRMAQLLEEADISYIIKDNAESARLAGFGSSANNVDLLVLEEDWQKAAEIIKSRGD